MLQALRRGFLRATENSSAWIITGGMNAGVMKLIGGMVSEQGISVPLIGIGMLVPPV
jgi:hypothetical protein